MGQGPTRGAGAPSRAAPGMWDQSHIAWLARLAPPGSLYKKGHPSLLIHQLIPDFSLDLVVPKLEPRRAEQGDLLHHSPLPRCWCSGPREIFTSYGSSFNSFEVIGSFSSFENLLPPSTPSRRATRTNSVTFSCSNGTLSIFDYSQRRRFFFLPNINITYADPIKILIL